MLDPKRIRSDKNYITKNFARRGVKVNLDEVIELDAQRRQLQSEADDLRAEKNRASKEIGLAKSEKNAISESKSRIRELNLNLKNTEIEEGSRKCSQLIVQLLLCRQSVLFLVYSLYILRGKNLAAVNT